MKKITQLSFFFQGFGFDWIYGCKELVTSINNYRISMRNFSVNKAFRRVLFNLSKPNDIYIYICHTAALTSRRYILNIYSTNINTEYFKHAA